MNGVLNELAPCDLSGRVERWIEQRTGGRVHSLEVETTGGRVIVRGQTGTFYVRQLALAAALEALKSLNSEQAVEVDIHVGRG